MPYERFIPYREAPTDTGQAQVLGTLGDRLRQFRSTAQSFLEPAIVRKASEAGQASGATGKPAFNSDFTIYGRAFNDAAMRSYVLTQYGDIQANVASLEENAGTDFTKFQATAKGYREGMLKNVDPRARSTVAGIVDDGLAEAAGRVGRLAAVEAKANVKADLGQGLNALKDDISRRLASGDPEQVAKGYGLMKTYQAAVESAIKDGTLSEREGKALVTEHLKEAIGQIAAGNLEREMAKPDGDPIGAVEGALKEPDLSDDERLKLAGDLIGRLNLHQAMVRERAMLDEATLKANADKMDRQATLDLLDGRLTTKKLRDYTEAGLDPSRATSLQNELTSGDTTSDDKEEYRVESNILDFTESDIENDSKLAWGTRRRLLEKRRQLSNGWQDSNAMQEARRRIDSELGIVPGTMQLIDEEKGRRRGRALTELYRRLNATDASQRDVQAIPMAESVIKDVLRGQASQDAERWQKRLKDLEGKDTSGMGKYELETHQKALERARQQLEAARKQASP